MQSLYSSSDFMRFERLFCPNNKLVYHVYHSRFLQHIRSTVFNSMTGNNRHLYSRQVGYLASAF